MSFTFQRNRHCEDFIEMSMAGMVREPQSRCVQHQQHVVALLCKQKHFIFRLPSVFARVLDEHRIKFWFSNKNAFALMHDAFSWGNPLSFFGFRIKFFKNRMIILVKITIT